MSFDSQPTSYRNHPLLTVDEQCLTSDLSAFQTDWISVCMTEPDDTPEASEQTDASGVLSTAGISTNRLPRECRELASLITTYTYDVDSSAVLADVKVKLSECVSLLASSCPTSGNLPLTTLVGTGGMEGHADSSLAQSTAIPAADTVTVPVTPPTDTMSSAARVTRAAAASGVGRRSAFDVLAAAAAEQKRKAPVKRQTSATRKPAAVSKKQVRFTTDTSQPQTVTLHTMKLSSTAVRDADSRLKQLTHYPRSQLYKAVQANIADCIPILASAVSNGRVPVTEDDLKSLLPGHWLTDNVSVV